MTEQETVQIIRQIKAYYPYLYKNITKEDAKSIIGVWQKQFKDIDYEMVEMAVDKWGERHTTAPSIAELKSSIFNLYKDYDRRYSELINDENADKKEIEKIARWRDIAWSCMTCSIK